jgi:hypothetical protein
MKNVFVILLMAVASMASVASATTTTLRLSETIIQENEQGGAAVNFRLGVHRPIAIEEARLNLAMPGAGPCVFKLDSRFGSKADAELYRLTASTTSTLWQPTRPIALSFDDDFTATWANTAKTSWSLEIVYSLLH